MQLVGPLAHLEVVPGETGSPIIFFKAQAYPVTEFDGNENIGLR